MAESFNVDTVMEAVLSKLRALTETGQTFGQPITIGDTIIVPYMSLYFGLGGGGGGNLAESREAKRPSHTLWGGAGGGVRIEPMGFLVVRGEKVELLTLQPHPQKESKTGQWSQLADSVLPLLQQWLASRSEANAGWQETNGNPPSS
ncbi:MAG: spore germination protein GerW family protein [Cyanobacteriota bacterium]|nr:spore germination protein GerW family protein [Cyanobacteriota bacterium]